MLKSKELLRNILGGQVVTRPLFLPLTNTFAARVAQLPLQDMFTNPTRLANSLFRVQKLVGYDAIFLYNPVYMAAGLGCSVQWLEDFELPVFSTQAESTEAISTNLANFEVKNFWQQDLAASMLETCKRIADVAAKQVGLVVGVTGPFTLLQQLQGRMPTQACQELTQAGEIVLSTAKSFAELRPDLVVIMESNQLTLNQEQVQELSNLMRPVANIVRYYNAFLGLHLPNNKPATFMDIDVLFYGEPTDLTERKKDLVLGLALDPNLFMQPKNELAEQIKRILRISGKENILISTLGELNHATPVENLRQLQGIWETLSG